MTQCESCKYCINEDFGYSNYTTEGTTKSCARDVHTPFDRFYGEASEFAKIPDPCPEYSQGEPIDMDVEGENYTDLTEEQKIVWEER